MLALGWTRWSAWAVAALWIRAGLLSPAVAGRTEIGVVLHAVEKVAHALVTDLRHAGHRRRPWHNVRLEVPFSGGARYGESVGGLVVTAFFLVIGVAMLWGRRYRTTAGDYEGPHWFGLLETLLFLT